MGIEFALRALGLQEFLALELPPREFLLNPWLSTQGLAMIHAPRGVGKTHVSLGIAIAVATGGEFLGWHAPRPRGVVFIDGEMPANLLQERISNIIASADATPTPLLKVVTPDLQSHGIPDLATQNGQQAIDRLVTPEIGLIVVDNLSTLLRSGAENEAESWEPVQTWALRHRAQGRAVLFVHHSGKGGTQRGTSRREDVLDTVVALRRPSDYTPQQGAAFEVYFEKARALYGKEVAPFVARLRTMADGRQQWDVESTDNDDVATIASLMQQGLTQTEIAARLNCHKSSISRMARQARHRGLLPSDDKRPDLVAGCGP